MHLDCVFSILGDDVCLMMDEMMGADSPTRRLVDEWTQDKVGPGSSPAGFPFRSTASASVRNRGWTQVHWQHASF